MEIFQEKSLREDQNYHQGRGRDYHQARDRDYYHQARDRDCHQARDRVRLEDTKQIVVFGSNDTEGKEEVLNRDQSRGDLDGSRICKVCGKKFRNGQALGGHISIHNILGPKKMDNKFKTTNQQLLQYSSWINDLISCHLCNKSFPSNKALYGHMGSHRRGSYLSFMSSPPSASSSSEYSEEDDDPDLINQDDDLVNFLPSWLKKDKRDDDIDLTKQDNYDLENFLPSWTKKDKRGRMSTSSSTALIANKPPDYNINGYASMYLPSSKKLKLKDRFKHGNHVCKICKKRFPTGQALGGHMRVHYNEKAAAKIKVAWTADHDDGEIINRVEAPLAPVNLAQPTSQEAIPLASRRMLDLDLNKSPEGFHEV